MPGMNGLEAASRIAERWPATRVIILSMHSNENTWRGPCARERRDI